MSQDAPEQNLDFALSPDGTSTAPPEANDPRYTPALADGSTLGDKAEEAKNTDDVEGQDKKVKEEGTGQGVQGQAEDNGGKTNADAADSDPNKTVKADGPVKTPGTTEAKASSKK